VVENASARRVDIQRDLMKRRLEEARQLILREGSGEATTGTEVTELDARNAKDLQAYQSTAEYPRDANLNRIRVDLDKEALLVPINGRLVPFHASTIKNMTQPDPDMRINFFIPGAALGKEVAKNMQHLVFKYGGKSTFIKELTFRASDGKNLSTVYQQFQELRRRIRQREQKVEQEKDLVVQTKLIRIKDQRVPRLQEITVRPQISGRKCIGTLEAHQNGLRFTSSKAEILDVMYANIKHAIFQPCDRTAMVLFHCNLVNPILVGKKSHKDVQFFCEVGEASLNLEAARRSSYDPDELEEEQRERELRKRLNLAFKEFCSKVEKVAAHYEFNLQIDVPFKKSGFVGNWSRDMVTMTPTTNCLVNLVEWPPFVLTLSEVEHVHFERVTYATKAFDLTFIFKNWDVLPRTINSIDLKYMEIIEDWLNLVEITFTKGPRSMNWVDVMKLAKSERQVHNTAIYDDDYSLSSYFYFVTSLYLIIFFLQCFKVVLRRIRRGRRQESCPRMVDSVRGRQRRGRGRRWRRRRQ
jgi:nucleosome binding factor SPN SPT16 subunit